MLTIPTISKTPGLEIIKSVFVFNSAEHETSLLINMKIPTIVADRSRAVSHHLEQQ